MTGYFKRIFMVSGFFLAGCLAPSAALNPPVAATPERVQPAPTSTLAIVGTLLPTATAAATISPTTLIPVTLAPTHHGTTARPAATPTATFAAYGLTQSIGTSAGGRPLTAHRFGFGTDTIILVGGIHGGYEWNTIVLAYEMIDYFEGNPDQIPDNVSLYIIPSANPDGQYAVTGQIGPFAPDDVAGDTRPGRFNDNEVDLNRNWSCGWQAQALWGDTVVSGGKVPFSEPETAALRTFILREEPGVVLFWHSKADGLYVGSCRGPHASSQAIAEVYGAASDYPVNDLFTAYPISGDASDWVASQNIPSFTVELKTHSQIDWDQNLAGVLALLDHYSR